MSADGGSAIGERWTSTSISIKLSRRIRERDEVTVEMLELIEQVVVEHPLSPRLWCLRGDMIQIGPDETAHSLDDARGSYERALEIDPDNAEALESLGHYFDAINSKPDIAESYFLKSIDHGAGKNAFVSLAELYLEQGRYAEALAILEPSRCPYSSDVEVMLVRKDVTEASHNATS